MDALPKWYRPVTIAALLWNLLGCAAYLADVLMTPEALAALPEAQRAMYEARPSWFVAAYAVAVWMGALGSLGLVLRKRWARGPLLASLLALVVQDLGLLTVSGMAAGAVAFVLQGLVFVIAVALVLLARRAQSAGWLA